MLGLFDGVYAPKVVCKPFITWVGGKKSILNTIRSRVPLEYNTYHEPFVGGGIVLFTLQPQSAVIYDKNPYLIMAYHAIKYNPDMLIGLTEKYIQNNSKEYYNEMRPKLSFASGLSDIQLASLFIYLNRSCFRGLYRVNSRGGYNSPFHHPIVPLNPDNIHACSKVLQNVEIDRKSFRHIDISSINTGDFVYMDPPYHETYDGYTPDKFPEAEQIALADMCHALDAKGVKFMLSNSNTTFIRDLYSRYTVEDITSARHIHGTKAVELLVRNYDS